MRGELRSGDVLTVAQLAEYLQLHKLTVYKYIREGRIPAVKIGRIIRIRAEEVGSFLLAQQVRSTERAGSRPRQPRASAPAAALQQSEVYVGPVHEEQAPPRDTIVTGNPLDWVIRGLH